MNLWRILDGKESTPDKAADLAVENEQRIHFTAELSKEHPSAMWTALKNAYRQKKPAQCFNAYKKLFSMQKTDDESLTQFASHIKASLIDIQALRDSRFTLESLDDELASMALLKGLPTEKYSNLRTSLFMTTKLLMSDLVQALALEEANTNQSTSDLAQRAFVKPSSTKASKASKQCTFCGRNSHKLSQCFDMKNTSKKRKEELKNNKKKGKQEEAKAVEDATAEFAGNTSTSDFTNPYSPLLLSASADWITDTVKLANNTTIYSVGIGSVKFQAVVNGKRGCLLEFHRVLHVPALKNNLLTRIDAYHYWITFIDDASRYWTVAPLKHKSDAFAAFKVFKALAENQLNARIKVLHDDKGGEYMSKEWEELCTTSGIKRMHTLRAEPYQNGVAERANRTIKEGITTMLNEAGLPPSFWWDAVSTFTHIHNRSPTSALQNSTPYELWFKKKPDVSYFRVFGYTAYVHIKSDQRKQLESHTHKCVFIGYPSNFKGWRFFNPDTRKEVISNSAVFDERAHSESSKTNVDLHVPGLTEFVDPVRESSELHLPELPVISQTSQNPQNAPQIQNIQSAPFTPNQSPHSSLTQHPTTPQTPVTPLQLPSTPAPPTPQLPPRRSKRAKTTLVPFWDASDEQDTELAKIESSGLSEAEIAQLIYTGVEDFALSAACRTEFLTFEEAYEHAKAARCSSIDSSCT
ncbi:retrotransposon unclassified [Pyrrhoderma noxium]|uniref:Retrotransposon unclassified n=1 Tax=Pyrrhoderma noxium TaxID=2282107 RepID=A0A286UAL2_9AGAM|nr:retrotransposon unclassified [Pyrrhoderma noxium]